MKRFTLLIIILFMIFAERKASEMALNHITESFTATARRVMRQIDAMEYSATISDSDFLMESDFLMMADMMMADMGVNVPTYGWIYGNIPVVKRGSSIDGHAMEMGGLGTRAGARDSAEVNGVEVWRMSEGRDKALFNALTSAFLRLSFLDDVLR